MSEIKSTPTDNKNKQGDYSWLKLFLKSLLLFGIVSLTKQVSGEKLDMGDVYDCSVTRLNKVFAIPNEKQCEHRFVHEKVKVYEADVLKYRPAVTYLKLSICEAKKITLTCSEKFFGDDHTQKVIVKVKISPEDCKEASETRKTQFGPLTQSKSGKFTTYGHHTYKCQWMKTKKVSFVLFSFRMIWGE